VGFEVLGAVCEREGSEQGKAEEGDEDRLRSLNDLVLPNHAHEHLQNR
jgi:hypothetical protein